MEKTFIQSALFGTVILVVYALMSPPLHLSAESSPALDTEMRVRKGTVTQIDIATQKMMVDFEGISVLVVMNASTTITSPNGEETQLSFLRDGSLIYVFGQYDNSARHIEAGKIVMRNRSIMERKSLSRAEMGSMKKNAQAATPLILDDLSLTAK